jgi:GNAT superfamily N-acetyltransferase
MNVRRLEAEDLEQVRGWIAQLGHAVELVPLQAFFHALEVRSDHALLVASESSKVLGWVHAYETQLLYSSRFAEVGGLVVDEASRRAGVGAALMRAVEAWAKERGCSQVRLRSRVIRREAHRFYERLGYANEKTQHTFAKHLD